MHTAEKNGMSEYVEILVNLRRLLKTSLHPFIHTCYLPPCPGCVIDLCKLDTFTIMRVCESVSWCIRQTTKSRNSCVRNSHEQNVNLCIFVCRACTCLKGKTNQNKIKHKKKEKTLGLVEVGKRWVVGGGGGGRAGEGEIRICQENTFKTSSFTYKS